MKKCSHGCEIREGARYANGCHACTIDRLTKECEELKEDKLRIIRGDFMQICSHCGWESYSECVTPESQWGQLQKHVRECEAHPMRKVESECANLKTETIEAEKAVADLMELNDTLKIELHYYKEAVGSCQCMATGVGVFEQKEQAEAERDNLNAEVKLLNAELEQCYMDMSEDSI